MIAASLSDWKVLLTVGLLVALAMVLTFRLMHRDSEIRRTRYGFFVERDRFDDEEAPWPNLLQPPEQRTLPQWPDQATQETPAKPKQEAP